MRFLIKILIRIYRTTKIIKSKAKKARFKLPRNQYYFCSRNSIGDLTEAALPSLPMHTAGEEVINFGLVQTDFFKNRIIVDNSYGPQYTYSGGIYGNSTTVQPLSINCYLMFYVN